jgi:hypothetical protein
MTIEESSQEAVAAKRQYWKRHLGEWQANGLTQIAYYRQLRGV